MSCFTESLSTQLQWTWMSVCLHCVLSYVIPKRALYLWLLLKNVRDNTKKFRKQERKKEEKTSGTTAMHSKQLHMNEETICERNDKIQRANGKYWFSKSILAIYVASKLISTTTQNKVENISKVRSLLLQCRLFDTHQFYGVDGYKLNKNPYIFYTLWTIAIPIRKSGWGKRASSWKSLWLAVDLLTDKLCLVSDFKMRD